MRDHCSHVIKHSHKDAAWDKRKDWAAQKAREGVFWRCWRKNHKKRRLLPDLDMKSIIKSMQAMG